HTPMRVIGFVRLEVWRARVDEPYGALLAQSKRNAVGREREDPVRRLDVGAVLVELLMTSVYYALRQRVCFRTVKATEIDTFYSSTGEWLASNSVGPTDCP